MFNLLFVALSLALVVYTALGSIHRFLEPLQALLLAAAGLAWRRLGERQTRYGSNLPWLGDGDVKAYARLYCADATACSRPGSSGERFGDA